MYLSFQERKEEGVGKTSQKYYEEWGNREYFESIVLLTDSSFDTALRKYDSMVALFYVDGNNYYICI